MIQGDIEEGEKIMDFLDIELISAIFRKMENKKHY